MIDEENWFAMDVDVKGAAFEGLLEKAASEGKKGAGQQLPAAQSLRSGFAGIGRALARIAITPRPLIQTICRVMKPDPRGNPDFRLCDPACGTGGFLVCAWEWLISKPVSGGVFVFHPQKSLSRPGPRAASAPARWCCRARVDTGLEGLRA